MARPRPDAGHHRPAVPTADSAWQYCLQPYSPSVGLTVQCGGLLSSPHQTPAALFCPPLGALRQRGAAIRLGAKGDGMATAPCWSMARDAPCPIRRPDKRRLASHRSNGLGAAFPSPGSWGCSMPAAVCSSSWSSRLSSPTTLLKCRRCIRAYKKEMCWFPIGVCVRMPMWPSSSRPASTPCSASARARWWISHRRGPLSGRASRLDRCREYGRHRYLEVRTTFVGGNVVS